MRYRLVPLPSRSRDDTTSGLAFLAFHSHNNRRKRGHGDLAGGGTWPNFAKMLGANRGYSYSETCDRQKIFVFTVSYWYSTKVQ